MLAAALCAIPARGLAATPPRTERVEITLDTAQLPAADRTRLADRAQSISDAIASGIPLWRSFEPREVLHDTLAALGRAGADVGDTAIVNFDTVELDVPVTRRARLDRLAFVSSVRRPGLAIPSGTLDSEGIEAIGSDIANTAGITGTGVKVAVIDSEWHSLADTITAHDLPAIPVSQQLSVTAGTGIVTANVAADGSGLREHGTAAAEVVHEVAPGATLLLYRINSLGTGGITSTAIEAAIRHAADQGAKVILVPLHFIRTMSDPRGIAQGGTNTFTDDIDYATAAGATVVVSAGNEALRHYSDTFTPCTDCTTATLCNDAPNDTSFHAWDGELPLNDLTIDDDYDEYAYQDGVNYRKIRVTCYSATDAAVPNNFKMQLIVNSDLDFDYPTCPRDAGGAIVAGTTVSLGESFTKDLTLYGGTGDNAFYNYFFLDVQRTGGSETPHFRIDCTTAVSELAYYHEESSLSDLAVVNASLSVAAAESPNFQFSTYDSSEGPSGDPNGPLKPDITGPSEVTNFAVDHEGFASWAGLTFNGTSAAASHVAGVVALLQSYRLGNGLAPYTVDQVKQILFASALDLDGLPSFEGPDTRYGHGLVQIPAAVLPGAPGAKGPFDRDGDVVTDPATYNASTGAWSWLGSTIGQTGITFGGASLVPVAGDFDGDGKVDAALYDPSNGGWTFTTTAAPESAASGIGGSGFVPAPGDYDGDGKTDPAVYNPTTGDWKWKGSTSGDGQQLGFGGPTRQAIPADFDGDGKTDVATFEKATGKWQYIGSTDGAQEFTFSPGSRWIPAPADFDGDGKADAATFQKKKGKWRMRLSSLGGLTSSISGIGASGWVPVPGDYDGDGKAEPAAYRKANGLWRWQGSKDGVVTQKSFGGAGFTPVVAQRF